MNLKPTPLMTIVELARYLNMSVGGLYHMLPRITEADGKIKIGRNWRFKFEKVVARSDAGLFARGLDANGKPITVDPVPLRLRAV